ncbi:GLUG motif-containing protein, partial [Brevibacillus sp. SIMBA_076]
ENLKLDAITASTTAGAYSPMLGGLVGINIGGLIRNVDAKNMTVANNAGEYGMVGGLVGLNRDGTLDNLRFDGRVSGRPDTLSIGGLVGENT